MTDRKWFIRTILMEIISEVKLDYIAEAGTFYGGSAVL